jgi:hypothetical protein
MGRTAQKGRLGDLRTSFRLIPFLFLLPPITVFGQTLHLSSASASPGEQVTIEISFQSPPGKEPSALQWEATIPSTQLDFVEQSMAPGPAAQAAGKSVSCALKTPASGTRTSVCILYGGLEPIHNGVVAVLRLHISREAKPGTARIRVDQGLAVSKDLKKVVLDPVEAVVKIRAK